MKASLCLNAQAACASAKVYVAAMAIGTALPIGLIAPALPLWTASAEAKVRIVPHSKAGGWNIKAVYAAGGPFNHCSASARYQSGTRVSIILYANGNWRLWFSHTTWPNRAKSAFPATVRVDGQVVLNQRGYFKGRNAYVDLGREIARVKALMRGRSMAVSTPAGTSRFKLTGTNRATKQVARCWTAHYRSPASRGAFGSANNSAAGGAFGGGRAYRNHPGRTTASSQRAIQLSRANTLDIATSYLSKARQPYSILPAGNNPLKHFPVNWKMQDGSIGGMRVFKNSTAEVDDILGRLLADQAKYCSRRNASRRNAPREIKGRRMASARGVCETAKGNVLNIVYKVAELGRRMLMMVMEVRSANGGNGATSRPASPKPGKNDAIYVPGPNDL